MACWKAHGRLSTRVSFSAIYYSSGVMRWNVYRSAVFVGVDLFALKFYLHRVVPQQPFLTTESYKHWATRQWRLHPSVFPCFDTIPECDGQTDKYVVVYTALAKLALWRAVKITKSLVLYQTVLHCRQYSITVQSSIQTFMHFCHSSMTLAAVNVCVINCYWATFAALKTMLTTHKGHWLCCIPSS